MRDAHVPALHDFPQSPFDFRPAVPMYLDGVLPDMAFTPGDVPMLGAHYIPTCTITSFPAAAYPGILDALTQLAFEYRWVTRFMFLGKEDAIAELEKYRKGWFQKQKGLATLLKEQATKQEIGLRRRCRHSRSRPTPTPR